ncbi:MAG: MGMT family protein [Pseudomonadota bacterium]
MPGIEKIVGGTVEKLYLKPRVEMEAGSVMSCIAGLGINGEKHANRLSPRQVLVTLASDLLALSLAPGVLYENMVVSLASPVQFQPGAALVFEGGAEIRLTMFCEPCSLIAPLVGKLSDMIDRRGILGVVVHGGDIRSGDAFSLIPGRYRALPDTVQQRFVDFLATIPRGRVVRYLDVTIALGVDTSFIRALPAYIKRAIGLPLPLHRIVNARGELLTYVPGQAALLAAEGVAVQGNRVDLVRYGWHG